MDKTEELMELLDYYLSATIEHLNALSEHPNQDDRYFDPFRTEMFRSREALTEKLRELLSCV